MATCGMATRKKSGGVAGKNLAELFPSRTEWWVAKIQRNMARDREVTETLQREGWKVIRLWEHDVLVDPDAAARTVLQAARAGDARRLSTG